MKRSLLLTILCAWVLTLLAQCPIRNTAFQGGERLDYKMYFNWKFVWLSAGTATFSTHDVQWEGQPAYQANLLTSTSKLIDKYFRLRDTLLCVTTPDIVPLYYKKAAHEGGRSYLDEVWYSYPEGKTHLRQAYRNAKGEKSQRECDLSTCAYDMMSMLMRARSFTLETFAQSKRLQFFMADGVAVDNPHIVFRGKEEVKIRDSEDRYRCLVISFIETDREGKEKEIITFFISDDDNHIPVRLDMFLKFGTAKAFLAQAQGLRHPMKAKKLPNK